MSRSYCYRPSGPFVPLQGARPAALETRGVARGSAPDVMVITEDGAASPKRCSRGCSQLRAGAHAPSAALKSGWRREARRGAHLRARRPGASRVVRQNACAAAAPRTRARRRFDRGFGAAPFAPNVQPERTSCLICICTGLSVDSARVHSRAATVRGPR